MPMVKRLGCQKVGWLCSWPIPPSVFSQKSFQSLHNIVQHCARLYNCRKLTSWQPNQLCIESYKFTFSSLATQAAFILGNFVHLYRAYLHFLNISEQYSFRDTSCTKRFNFRKSLKKPQKSATWQEKCGFADVAIWRLDSSCTVRAAGDFLVEMWAQQQLLHLNVC